MELHEWNGVSSYTLATPWYPRSLADELQQTTIPPYVNAGDITEDGSKLYLVSGNIVYEYDIIGRTPPHIVYAFQSQFDITVNGF